MIEVRKTTGGDIECISMMFEQSTGRLPSNNMPEYISKYPSVVAIVDGELIGFCYSKPFAPDILELMNIFVAESHRGEGLGKKIIKEFESISFKEFGSVILVNSTLYPSKETKRLATKFYLECGYREIMATSNSKVFGKDR